MNQKDIEALMELGKAFSEKLGSVTDTMLSDLEKENPEEAKKAREEVKSLNLNKHILDVNKGLKEIHDKINNLNGSVSN